MRLVRNIVMILKFDLEWAIFKLKILLNKNYQGKVLCLTLKIVSKQQA